MCARSWNIACEGSYAPLVTRKPDRTRQGALKRAERERSVGLDPEDEAARWLEEHDPPPPEPEPKAAKKSKAVHRFRQQQQRNR